VTTSPLVLSIFAWVRRRDRPVPAQWIGLAVALCGVVLIAGSDWRLSGSSLAGDGLAFAGACAMAGYLLVARRLGHGLRLASFSWGATSMGALVLLGLAGLSGSLRLASLDALGYLALSALVPQLVGHSLLTWALRHARPVAVGLATVGEPALATGWGWLWLGESVAWSVGLGCLLTLSAVGTGVWIEGRSQMRARSGALPAA
jgi:drug/metabolite transporter (DMT)-like permease